jgi:N-acyl-D-aspartate/D-glutamate deacylase
MSEAEMAQADFVIRNGLVVDGSGRAPIIADVAFKDKQILSVGRFTGDADEEFDATGLVVAPGWVDIHTHFDGQATWESHLTPASRMGCTTVVFGNCGVGFAPVRLQDRNRLIRLMEGIEDIPGTALHEGLDWSWESFEDYLDVLDAVPHDIDIAAHVPHAALRVYVMGKRAVAGEAAAPAEIVEMARLVKQALLAGAIGFSSSRTLIHRSADNDPVPTVLAERAELIAIAEAMREVGAGVFQFTSDFTDLDAEFSLFEEMAATSGRPLSFAVTETASKPDKWRVMLQKIEQARQKGLKISAQVAGRPTGMLVGLQGSIHPYIGRPSYEEVSHLPLSERVKAMREPERRRCILAEPPVRDSFFLETLATGAERIFELGDPPVYDPDPAMSIGARARAHGISADEMIFDAMTRAEGKGFLYLPLLNYVHGNLNSLHEMLTHPYTINGLSDGGAHVGMICDSSVPTFMLTYWVRDRRGPRLSLAEVVKRQTNDTAHAVGLLDRGMIAPGMRADVNIVDFARLKIGAPYMAHDLPGGARRLLQDVEGYVATFVGGELIYRDGEATGAMPGALLRPQPSQAFGE